MKNTPLKAQRATRPTLALSPASAPFVPSSADAPKTVIASHTVEAFADLPKDEYMLWTLTAAQSGEGTGPDVRLWVDVKLTIGDNNATTPQRHYTICGGDDGYLGSLTPESFRRFVAALNAAAAALPALPETAQ